MVKNEVKKYFKRRFVAQPKLKLDLDTIFFKSIIAIDSEMICGVFSEQEILEAVKQCGSYKSPGPNGFNFHFITNNWDVMG